MKVTVAVLLCFIVSINFGQEKEIRKTFGVNVSLTSLDAGGEFYHRKIGFMHRRCFKGFVLQTEFNRLLQNDPKSVLYTLDNGNYVFHGEDSLIENKVSKSQKYFNTQISLSKGWTNDKVNLYLGLGLSLGQSKADLSSNVATAKAINDTLGIARLEYNRSALSTSGSASYIHAGVVVKASAEIKLFDRVSMLVQFSPEISGAWRYKAINEYVTRDKYAVMTNSLLEVGVHYRL